MEIAMSLENAIIVDNSTDSITVVGMDRIKYEDISKESIFVFKDKDDALIPAHVRHQIPAWFSATNVCYDTYEGTNGVLVAFVDLVCPFSGWHFHGAKFPLDKNEKCECLFNTPFFHLKVFK